MDDLTEDAIAVGARQVLLRRPRDTQALLDEQAFERDEFLPYWAELWPSALALARAVTGRALRGARVVELGCGLGLPSIVAALAGGRVLATDWSADAVSFAAHNAALNGASLETAVVDWAEPEGLEASGPFQMVLASDVLYEQRDVVPLLELLPRLGGEVWLSDPGRGPAAAFLEAAAEHFEVTSRPDPAGPRVRVHRLRPRPADAGLRLAGTLNARQAQRKRDRRSDAKGEGEGRRAEPRPLAQRDPEQQDHRARRDGGRADGQPALDRQALGEDRPR